MPLSRLANIKFKDFIGSSLKASVVARYWYCAAIISNMKVQGEIKTPIMIEGAILHEEEAQELLSRMPVQKAKTPDTLLDALVFHYAAVKNAVSTRGSLVNSDEGTMYIAILPELGCVGKPDIIDCSTGSPVVVEKKFAGRIPYRPWTEHEVQLAIYMLSLERLGFNPTHGFLEYHERGITDQKRFKVPLDNYSRNKVERTIETVRGLIERDEAPIPTRKPQKCLKCNYVNDCPWKLI